MPWKQLCWMVIQTQATKEHYVSFRYAALVFYFKRACQRKFGYSLACFCSYTSQQAKDKDHLSIIQK